MKPRSTLEETKTSSHIYDPKDVCLIAIVESNTGGKESRRLNEL